jgi:hypothetical protein
MDFRLRHAAGITVISALLVTTAAAQSNLGWTWSTPLVFPGEQGGGSLSSSSRSSYQPYVFSARSSSSYSYSRAYSLASYGSSRSASFGMSSAPSDNAPLTWGDLRRYHQEVIVPLQQQLMSHQIPAALPDTGSPMLMPSTDQAPPADACTPDAEGQIHDAADACNVCLCKGGAWACTHYACNAVGGWRACIADSDCGQGETCSIDAASCDDDCREGMQACGPGLCGGICKPSADSPQCGDGQCEDGEANICATCMGSSCATVACLQGTCPMDCKTGNTASATR